MFNQLKEKFCTSLSQSGWTDLIQECDTLKLYVQNNEVLQNNFENVLKNDYQSDLVGLLENLRKKIYSHLNHSWNSKNG